jgi:hypothetical protein
VRNNKPAFGIEGSKNFGTHFRAYYHLLALEKFMDTMGIEYERRFEMNPFAVKNAIDNVEVKVALYDNKLLLPVGKARNYLYYIPMKKYANVEYTTDHPLVAVVEQDRKYRVCYGNRRMALLHPQYFEYDDSLHTIDMKVDGYERVVSLGTVVNVGQNFLIKNQEGYRVNVIGYTQDGMDNEVDVSIDRRSIVDRFSIDTEAKIYRVEIYRDGKFSGMILVNFDEQYQPVSHTVAKAQVQSESVIE